MGGISLWHWIILFLFFVLPVLAIGGLAWFLVAARALPHRRHPAWKPACSAWMPCWSRAAITTAEHARQRAEIVRSL